MASKIESYLRAAVDHIAKFGDTDVLPFPIENHIFFDLPAQTTERLIELHERFHEFMEHDRLRPSCEHILASVGYNGFRSVTQIDPLWNAYLLGLTLFIGDDIERARVPVSEGMVFSYRFRLDPAENTVFDGSVGWHEFQAKARELATPYQFVLATDISDFYPRVYHHPLKNALDSATARKEEVLRIDMILNRLSQGASFGLPVGGPAARLLSESMLNVVDQLLIGERITFCRFADDYRIYAESREHAHRHLLTLSKALHDFGLSLQKNKTRVMSREEFIKSEEPEGLGDANSAIVTQSFLALKLYYDPYSVTADNDYAILRDELRKFDIVGMLTRETQKIRINQLLARKLIKSIRYLDSVVREHAILSLLESLPVLYPVFPTIAIVLKSQIGDIDKEIRSAVFSTLLELLAKKSYITEVPTNMAYAIRILAHDPSQLAYQQLNEAFKTNSSPLIKRDIILAMAKQQRVPWITAHLDDYWRLSPWEQRALIIASYYSLDDKGRHWREKLGDKAALPPLHALAMQWSAEKKNSGHWDLPA